jgi:hypothetical protein
METPQGEIGQPSLLARIAAEDQAVMEQIQCDHKDIVLVMKQITETIVAGMDLCGGVPLPNGAPQWVARFNTKGYRVSRRTRRRSRGSGTAAAR